MAAIKSIIDELSTIATAFSSVNSFIFDELQAINRNVSKSYPCILINANQVDYSYTQIGNSYLPKKKEFSLSIFFLDTYSESLKSTENLQTKLNSLELIAEQYLAEVRRRTIADPNIGFKVVSESTTSGLFAQEVHNDRLVQVTANITVNTDNQCTTGSFSY